MAINIERSSLNNNFDKNMLALNRAQPSVYKLIASTAFDHSYRILMGKDGSPFLCKVSNGRGAPLSHHENAVKKSLLFLERNKTLLEADTPLFFCGALAGFEIMAMISNIEQTDWKTPRAIYIYEENINLLRLNLLLRDWSEFIEKGRLFFFTGKEAGNELEGFFKNDPAKPKPEQVLLLGDKQMAARAVKSLQTVKKTAIEKAVVLKKKTESFYSAFPLEKLAKRYLDPQGLRFLIVSNKLSYFIRYSVRDIKMALESLGANARILEEKDPIDRLNGLWLLSVIDDFKPHGLLFIDHLRSEYQGIYPKNLPFVCWVQDFVASIHDLPKGELTDYDLLVGYTNRMNIKQFDPARLFHLPTLTNPDIFKNRPKETKVDPEWDFSFVSNISADIEKNLKDLKIRYKDLGNDFTQLLDHTFLQIKASLKKGERLTDYDDFYTSFLGKMKKLNPELSPGNSLFYEVYTNLFGAAQRHQALEYVSNSGKNLAIWGRGWEDHPTLAKHAKGVVENGPDLLDLYQKTKINLHVNQFVLEHPRILDGIMAGGFFLARDVNSSGLLEIKECLFKDNNELKSLIDKFSKNPELRHDIVKRNQRIIKKWATYKIGMKNFLAFFAIGFIDNYFKNSFGLENNVRKYRVDILKSLGKLADRFLFDSNRFGLYTCISILREFGMVPKTAIDAIDSLDEYHTKWGSRVWPPSISDAARKKVFRLIKPALNDGDCQNSKLIAIILKSWVEQETKDALVYRFKRYKNELHEKINERIDQTSKGSMALMPIYSETISRAHKQNRGLTIKESGMAIIKARTYVKALALHQKGLHEEALNLLHPLIDDKKTVGRIIFEAAFFAEQGGFLNRSKALLDRYENWLDSLNGKTDDLDKNISGLRKTILGQPGRPYKIDGLDLPMEFDLPPCHDRAWRVDKIRALGDDLLVLGVKSEKKPLLFFSIKEKKWIAPEGLEPYLRRSMPFPAFDARNGKLFLIDNKNRIVNIFDSSFDLIGYVSLGDPHIDFVNEMAAGDNDQLCVIDSYMNQAGIYQNGKFKLNISLNQLVNFKEGQKHVFDKSRDDYLLNDRLHVTPFEMGFLFAGYGNWLVFDKEEKVYLHQNNQGAISGFHSSEDQILTLTPNPMKIKLLDKELSSYMSFSISNHPYGTANFGAACKHEGDIWVADNYNQSLARYEFSRNKT